MSRDLTEDQIYNLSDEELEAVVLDIRSEEQEQLDEVEPVETTKEVEEDLEIPDVESDENETEIEEETEAEEVEETEESEPEEEKPDEDLSEEDDQPEVETKEPDNKPSDLNSYLNTTSIVKANGKEFSFTNQEKLDAFDKLYPQAMDYTKKTQAIKPWRKTIDALETAKLNHEDISLMIDVLQGDKDAINQVLTRTGVDTLDLGSEDSKYTPKDYGRDETALDVKDVISRISSDSEYEITQRVLSTDWDEASFNTMTAKPQMIEQLHIDVKSGLYDKIQLMAEKAKLFAGVNSGKSDLDFYIQAAGEYNLAQTRAENEAKQAKESESLRLKDQEDLEKLAQVKAKQTKNKQTKQNAKKRKEAAPTKQTAGASTVIDYLDDSDESFDEWYKSVQDSR